MIRPPAARFVPSVATNHEGTDVADVRPDRGGLLAVLRHAAATSGGAGHDHDRPLSVRGQRMLPAIRASLRPHAEHIDVVLCSSAARARATLDGVREVLAPTTRIITDEDLYGAGSDTWMRWCQNLDVEVAGALLVGHNPGLEALVHELAPSVATDDAGTPPPSRGLSPGSMAVLTVPAPWRRLGYDTCNLANVHHPTTQR